MALEQRLQRRQTEIKNVLMVDRVEFTLLHEVRGVRKLQNDPPTRLNQGSETRNEIIRVRGVGKDIVAQNQIGLVAGGQFLSQSLSEKFDQGFDTLFLGDLGDIPRRFDPQTAYGGGFEVLQEIAIVAGHLNYKAV